MREEGSERKATRHKGSVVSLVGAVDRRVKQGG